MIEQMIVPKTIIQVTQEVPEELQKHAGQELFVEKRQRKDIGQFQIGGIGIRILLSSGLDEQIYQYQDERKITEDQNQLILIGRTGQCVSKQTAQQ